MTADEESDKPARMASNPLSSCSHKLLEPALDRWSECHWHLHQMELNYHEPEPFRYSLNSFLRASKEVPAMLFESTQGAKKLSLAIKPARDTLLNNDLFRALKKTRDYVVHRGMLQPQSHGRAGSVRGNIVKMAMSFPVEPWESSDQAYARFKAMCQENQIIRQVLGPDEDSVPAVWRTWVVAEFPERDLLEVAFEAWTKLGEVLSAAVVANGGVALDLTMPCRHDPAVVQLKRYSQRDFFREVDGIDLDESVRAWEADRAARRPQTRDD